MTEALAEMHERTRGRIRAKDHQAGQNPVTETDLPGEVTDADVVPSAPVRDDAWHAEITRRLRVLLHADPLFRLRLRGDAQLGSARDLAHYDSLSLVFKVLDVVLERTGLESELDVKGIVAELRPLLVGMDIAAGVRPDPERHKREVERILAWLFNDPGRREPYRVEYTDFDENGVAVRRTMNVTLMREEFTSTGQSVPRLTPEATNLYLNAINFPIEDRQVAFEAMIRTQIQRGRFREAMRSARAALILSGQYRERIEQILRQTQKDIRQVDWRERIPKLLEEARAHVKERATAERDIVQAAEEKLNHLKPGSPEAREVAGVISLIEECYKQHTRLEERLIGAIPTFLDEHARQAFHAREANARIDIRDDLLVPLMTLSKRSASEILPSLVAAFNPPVVPRVFWLDHLVTRLLQPKREMTAQMVEVTERDLANLNVEELRFPTEIRQRADRWLERIDGRRMLLSELLQEASSKDEPQNVLELIALRAFHAYTREIGSTDRIRAEKTGRQFSVSGISGDDLELERIGAKHAVAS